jgi:hypothetical protein
MKSDGFSVPVAVGFATASSEEIRAMGEARKGKALRIVHVYRDALWALGDQSDPPSPSVIAERLQPVSVDAAARKFRLFCGKTM